MLYLILVDSALELIPKDIGRHNAIGKNIKRLGDAGKILDSALHHSAMTQLPNHTSRGRPDIVHHFLIDTLSSFLNKWGLLRIFIHLRTDNKIYEINPLMRPPKEYLRFKGVMHKLLKENVLKLPPGAQIVRGSQLTDLPEELSKSENANVFLKPRDYIIQDKDRKSGPPVEFLEPEHFSEYGEEVLARRIKKPLLKFIGYLNPDRVIKFEKIGDLKLPTEIFGSNNPQEHIVGIIGGFQSGGYSELTNKIRTENISIFPANLETWAVYQRVISNYEIMLLNSAQQDISQN